jgi:hypothetical protein
VAPLELFPSVWGFVSRDTGTATAFAIFGASWLVQGIELLVAHGQKPSAAVGFFEFSLVLILVLLAAVTFAGKPLIGVLIVVAIIRDIADALFEFGLGASWGKMTAICGLVVALLAFYSAFAFLEEDVKQRLSPLTFRSGAAKKAMEGGLEEQIDAIAARPEYESSCSARCRARSGWRRRWRRRGAAWWTRSRLRS